MHGRRWWWRWQSLLHDPLLETFQWLGIHTHRLQQFPLLLGFHLVQLQRWIVPLQNGELASLGAFQLQAGIALEDVRWASARILAKQLDK